MPRHDAGAVILHHYISLAYQLIHDFLALGVLDLHADAFLAGAGGQIERALAVLHKMNLPSQVAAGGAFDFDDIRPEVGQNPGGGRAGEILGKVEHGYAGQEFRCTICLVSHVSSSESSLPLPGLWRINP